MSDYVGKICPFCRTEITESDSVTVCPVCSIAHHEGCWEENKGCTTFGCSEKINEAQGINPTDVCSKCGTALGDSQQFCPNCGSEKNAQPELVCGMCGTPLKKEQKFCPKCGQKTDVEVDKSLGLAIDAFNADVEKKKQKSKFMPIIIAVALILCIGIGVFVHNNIQKAEAKKAKEEYIANVEEYLDLSLTAALNLEEIADTVQTYWYENIWYDKHGYDINDAIYYALRDKSSEISLASSYDSQMQTLYAKIKDIPDAISEKDMDTIKELREAVIELHNVYTDFYSLATDPSGSYNSYSSNNNSTTDSFLSKYRALENLIK